MMNKFMKCLNIEIEYMTKSRLFLSIAIIFLIISVIISFIQYNYVIDAYTNYQNMEEYYINNNIDIEADLSLNDYHIVENEDGTATVENPILYYNDMVCRAIYSVSAEYAVAQTFEISIAFLPILFFIIGSSIVVKDYKYKITKHKILRFGKTNYILTKLVTIFLIISFSIASLAVITKLSSAIINTILSNTVPLEKFNVGSFEQSSNIITKILLITFFSMFYSLLGALFGTIFKNSLPGITLAVMYLYVCPIKLKYEPKNMIYTVMKEHFDFIGLADISSTIDCSYIYSFLVLTCIIVLSIVFMVVITQKRSAYD